MTTETLKDGRWITLIKSDGEYQIPGTEAVLEETVGRLLMLKARRLTAVKISDTPPVKTTRMAFEYTTEFQVAGEKYRFTPDR